MRTLTQPRHKTASLGGDGQDSSFEQAFSNIAHTLLNDSAPKLFQHELGFQLIDRDPDGKKAIGVLAFKMGSQYAYVPVFFLKGQCKGHEILYLKNQDLCVPCKENWVNKIINQKPAAIGQSVGRQSSALGVKQPDLQRLASSPQKYASWVSPAIRPYLPKHASFMLRDKAIAQIEEYKSFKKSFSLLDAIKAASYPALAAYVRILTRFPKVARAYDKWYGLQDLHERVKAARADWETKDPIETAVVNYRRPNVKGDPIELITKDAHSEAKAKLKIRYLKSAGNDRLTDDEREKLLENGVLITDDRPEEDITKAYRIQTTGKLFNPSITGLHMTLVAPGEFNLCYIAFSPTGYSSNGKKCLVVNLDEDDHPWDDFHSRDVWCCERLESDEWAEWFDDLPDSSTLGSKKKTDKTKDDIGDDRDDKEDFFDSMFNDNMDDETYMLVGPREDATAPFVLNQEIGELAGSKSFDVSWRMPTGILGHGGCNCMAAPAAQSLHIDSRSGTSIRSNEGHTYVPEGFKILNLSDRANPLRLGTSEEAQRILTEKTAGLRLRFNSDRYYVNHFEAPLKEAQALEYLMAEVGLREKAARELIKTAHEYRQTSVRLKFASPYLSDQGPTAPGFPEPDTAGYNPMGFKGETQTGYEQHIPIPDMSSSNSDREDQNPNPDLDQDPSALQAVQQAAANGEKTVFDTASIGTLIKSQAMSGLKRLIPAMIKGMDATGRALIIFYAHGEEIAEHYGKQDMPELEDNLRTTFDQLGDNIIFLEEKTVEPFPEFALRDLDLEN